MRCYRRLMDGTGLKTELFKDFICRCNDQDRARADKIMSETRRRLGEETEDMFAVEVTDANLLTTVVQSLWLNFSASIEGIHTDQWSAVIAQTFDKTFKTYIQCDTVEDGIAATWKAFADRAESMRGSSVGRANDS